MKKQQNKWAISEDGEFFNGEIYDTKEEAIRVESEEREDGGGFWIGQINEVLMGELVNAESIIEDINERAYDNYGESAEDFLTDVRKEEIEELDQLIVDWFIKKGYKPAFFSVSNVEQVIIEK